MIAHADIDVIRIRSARQCLPSDKPTSSSPRRAKLCSGSTKKLNGVVGYSSWIQSTPRCICDRSCSRTCRRLPAARGDRSAQKSPIVSTRPGVLTNVWKGVIIGGELPKRAVQACSAGDNPACTAAVVDDRHVANLEADGAILEVAVRRPVLRPKVEPRSGLAAVAGVIGEVTAERIVDVASRRSARRRSVSHPRRGAQSYSKSPRTA